MGEVGTWAQPDFETALFILKVNIYIIALKKKKREENELESYSRYKYGSHLPVPPPAGASSLLLKRTAWGGKEGGGRHRRAKPSTAAAGGCGRRPGAGRGSRGPAVRVIIMRAAAGRAPGAARIAGRPRPARRTELRGGAEQEAPLACCPGAARTCSPPGGRRGRGRGCGLK